jgi:hypothetical protein
VGLVFDSLSRNRIQQQRKLLETLKFSMKSHQNDQEAQRNYSPFTDWYPAPETAVIGLEFPAKRAEIAVCKRLLPSELRDDAVSKCRAPLYPLLLD